MRKFLKSSVIALMLFSSASSVLAEECIAGVQSALDRQREQYIAAQTSMANQGFSRRPGSFAETTCLDTLMQNGGMDILFQPPSLDTILGMVKNLACAQASQIFEKLTGGGGGLSGVSSILKAGEIAPGINLNGALSSLTGSSSARVGGGYSTTNVNTSLRNLFQ